MRLFFLLSLLAGGGLQASPILYTLQADDWGTPRQLVSIDASGGGPLSVATLGDGSLAFNGGLVYRSDTGRFYAVANDGTFTSSTLYSFGLDGNLTVEKILGDNFFGGLAWDGSVFYVFGGDVSDQTLYAYDPGADTVAPIGSTGAGIVGGLAWDGIGGVLYGISLAPFGDSYLNQIDPSTGQATPLFLLGSGFLGGIAVHGSDLYSIADPGSSHLYRFGPGGPAVQLQNLGEGFYSAGLVIGASGPSAVPEPSASLLIGSGLIGLAFVGRRRTR